MSRPPPDVATALRRGVRLFNAGRYLSAHALWEEVWRDAASDDRALLEGLIQLAGGLHLRTRRGGTRGAVHLLAQAMVTLEDYRPTARGIDVERLVGDCDAFIGWLKQVNRRHRALDRLRLPRVHSI